MCLYMYICILRWVTLLYYIIVYYLHTCISLVQLLVESYLSTTAIASLTHVFCHVKNHNDVLHGSMPSKKPCARQVRPVLLLTLSLLILLDSNFPVDPLWAWEFHPFKLRLCWSRTLGNPQC